jgi:hypothetical protein
MPLNGVWCPACKDTFSDFEHWREDEGCKGSAQARAHWHSLLDHALKDTRHCNGLITITRLLTCPREWILHDFIDHPFNPTHAHTPHVGTLVQENAAKYPPLGWVAERKVAGKLFGLEVSASIDLSWMFGYQVLLSTSGDPVVEWRGAGKICEGKFHSTDKDGYKEWTLKDDHVAQVNMQRLLWEQCEPGLKVVEMKVTRSSMVGAGKEMRTFKVPVWDEERIRNHRPGGGDFTVGQIAGFAEQSLWGIKGALPEDYTRWVKEIPLIGRAMFNKTKCDRYCALKAVCDEVEGIV